MRNLKVCTRVEFAVIDTPPTRSNTESGNFVSPSFPNPSPDRIFFDFYIVQVPEARSIEFVFDFFCTEPEKDFLYYGPGNSPSVAAFPNTEGVSFFNGGQTIENGTAVCDPAVPNPFTIEGDSAWFRYDTDQNIMSRGFNLTYTVDPDDCNPNPCQNGGICDDLNRNYSCMCLPGFEGRDCQINIDECASNPCLNNAVQCLDGPNFFFCVCAPGYTGTRCETEIDPCLSEPCLNNATCSELRGDTSIPFQCLCVDGFAGEFCEEDIDECASMPCQNNATCNNLLNMYTCDCPNGFEGVNCETGKSVLSYHGERVANFTRIHDIFLGEPITINKLYGASIQSVQP
ncbi:Fibropellin-1 [Holothuria leucospilota]|uniref:Fibropellin-1 n=1 Tax=Holothuria leucospilota TaxID=206669 RepID=A0A9Q1H8U1_HOLLE|nr:Fibropellin-1 [Holothuria leucospilota]